MLLTRCFNCGCQSQCGDDTICIDCMSVEELTKHREVLANEEYDTQWQYDFTREEIKEINSMIQRIESHENASTLVDIYLEDEGWKKFHERMVLVDGEDIQPIQQAQ